MIARAGRIRVSHRPISRLYLPISSYAMAIPCSFRRSLATKDESKPPFWEVPDNETNDMGAPRSQRATRATKEFKNLLEVLFTQPEGKGPSVQEPPVEVQEEKPKKWTGSLIEKRLLEMVYRGAKTYEKTSPLPRGVSLPLYSRDRIQKARSDEQISLQRTASQEDAAIVARDREIQVIDSILETRHSEDLLSRVILEIFIPANKTYPLHYARAVAKAIEHASMSLGDPYLAMAIFEQVKNKSIESYVSGCTVETYNAMLLVRWRFWGDVNGMMSLVEEMNINGVEYDETTRRIVRGVVREFEGDSDFGEPEDDDDNISWSMDERRTVNTMKALVGKWIV